MKVLQEDEVTGKKKKIAKEFGGKKTPGSGNKAVKGDVQTDTLMFECKTTAKTQYTLKLYDFDTHYKQASTQGKVAIFLVELDDEAKGTNRELVVLSKVDFNRLLEGNI